MINIRGCVAFTAIVLGSAIGGCSSSGSEEATALGATPLMTVTSQSGNLKIAVRTSPQPPVRGTNNIELTITGATDGAPRDGLALGIKPWMPAMGHGTSIVPMIAPETGGKYLVSNVDLFMAGLWELRLTIPGTPQDYAAPSFQIQ
jgi:hypothetical protein